MFIVVFMFMLIQTVVFIIMFILICKDVISNRGRQNDVEDPMLEEEARAINVSGLSQDEMS